MDVRLIGMQRQVLSLLDVWERELDAEDVHTLRELAARSRVAARHRREAAAATRSAAGATRARSASLTATAASQVDRVHRRRASAA